MPAITFKRFVPPAGEELWPEVPPLHWAPVSAPEQEVLRQVGGGQVVAIVSCKNGHACCLRVGGESRFTVTAAGVVWPSIACSIPGCGGHEDAGCVLEGYGT